MKDKTKLCAFVGIAAALSFVIARMTSFPVFAAATYLKLHFGETVLDFVTLCGGLSIGIWTLLVKEFLSFFINGSNIFGLISDFVLVGAMLVTTSLVYKWSQKYKGGILIAFSAGAIVRTILSIPVNILILKWQYGTPLAGVLVQMPWILAFNVLKTYLNAICVSLLHARINKPLQRVIYR